MRATRNFRGGPLSALWVCALWCAVAGALAADPLPSWNDGAAKRAILQFAKDVTTEGGKDFVPPEERIATFDNDGTLWVEQPLYTQVVFALDRVKALAPEHPEWKSEEPFKSLLTGGPNTLARFSNQDFLRVVTATHTGITVDEFEAVARAWLATAKHSRYQRLYTHLVYQPMLEVMQYLRASGFKTYIVTGGGQDFVRAFGQPVYGVPPEQTVGSAGKTKYQYASDGKPQLVKVEQALYIDDKGGKVEGINLMIGRRPLAAFGNSTGDQQMLEWTQAGGGSRLMMLVHHDDARREYAYGADSKIGTFSDALMAEARERGWHVISMENDWNRIFPFEQ